MHRFRPWAEAFVGGLGYGMGWFVMAQVIEHVQAWLHLGVS